MALAVMVVLGLALVLVGRLDTGLRRSDLPEAPALPEQPWSAADVRGMRFRVALRGYRMQDVDAMLTELAAELESRESPQDVATSDSPTDGPASQSAG